MKIILLSLREGVAMHSTPVAVSSCDPAYATRTQTLIFVIATAMMQQYSGEDSLDATKIAARVLGLYVLSLLHLSKVNNNTQ